MSKYFVVTMVFGQLFAGAAIAEDYPGRDAATLLIAQCQQEAQANGAADTDAYVRDCIDERMGYEADE
jgi:hypothetical protein